MVAYESHAAGWVYHLADYRRMFDLSDHDLEKKILDYPGGISSFNAQMWRLGHHVTSGDQFYHLENKEIEEYANYVYSENLAYLHAHTDNLKSKDEEFIKKVLNNWEKIKNNFVQDYPEGKASGRYHAMHLPTLPFEDHSFDLALCADLMFHTQGLESYTPEHLIQELCRVAVEVRVYPLQNEKGMLTEALGPILKLLQELNFGVEVREVPYEMRIGGNAMLRVWANECVV